MSLRGPYDIRVRYGDSDARVSASVDEALGNVSRGLHMRGVELPRGEVSALCESTVLPDFIGFDEIIVSDDVSQLSSRVFERDAVRAFTAPNPQTDSGHVRCHGLANGVMAGSHRESGVVLGEHPSRANVSSGIVDTFTCRAHVRLDPPQVARSNCLAKPVRRHVRV